MSVGDSLRILGVPAESTPEQIRQAYLDLVRVWHPDRFQSDSRLRQIAQEHLCEINEAYTQLKSYRYAGHSRTASQAQAAEGGRPQHSGTTGTATEDLPQRENVTCRTASRPTGGSRGFSLPRFIAGKAARG